MSLMRFSDERLAEVVRRAASDHGVPGVAVGWRTNDVRGFVSWGVTSIDNPLGVTPSTRFQIGSVTKTFTATAVAVLAERGLLDLDAPVIDRLPQLKHPDRVALMALTPRLLLNHQAGLFGDWILAAAPDFGAGDDALDRMAEAVGEVPFLVRPGAAFSYSNTGFCLAGLLVATVLERSYEQGVHDLVLGAVGLDDSCFSAEEAITHRVAVGHHTNLEGQPQVARGATRWSPRWALQRAANPAGGLISTASDQLRWAEAFLEPAALSRDVVGGMLTIQGPSGGQGTHVGLGWHFREVDGVAVWSHNGVSDGYVAHTLFVPDCQLAATILTNSSMGFRVIHEARTSILEQAGLCAAPFSYDADIPSIAGTYADPLRHITITPADSSIAIGLRIRDHVGDPLGDAQEMTARPIGEGRLVITSPSNNEGQGLEYDTSEAQPTWFRLRGRLLPRVSAPCMAPGHRA
ncbi:MAG: serine hydrolase domain-containing protein [Microthrixaceae bacterium]